MFFSIKLKRIIALTLIILILTNVLAPAISVALTSGPSRPESTSFEPVDTSDMVNLLTGDLAYNIPLLEVPGPEGGYPLSLSYHAGTGPEIESSWVGLNWTLNPGSIDRQVSGFADDFNGSSVSIHDYWAGGNTTYTSVGVSGFGATLGVTVAHDTYKGVGVGFNASYGFRVYQIDGVGIGASIGVATDPFGGGLSVNGDVSAQYIIPTGGSNSSNSSINAKGSIGLGFSTNFKSLNVGASAGLSLTDDDKDDKNHSHASSLSLIGASLSTNQHGANLAVAGGESSVENVNFGKIQTTSKHSGFGLTVLGFGLSISHTYMRYWSDTQTTSSVFGTLNYPQSSRVTGGTNQYDTFYLPDISDPNYSLTGTADPATTVGGSLPDYDTYTVMGQGISGNIRPYAYQAAVEGKARTANTYKTNLDNNSNPMVNPAKLYYRFMDDFSNRYIQNDVQTSPGNNVLQFDPNPVFGLNDGNYGYNQSNQRLASSKDVEYFTNADIENGNAQLQGFIDTHAAGFNRLLNPDGTSAPANDTRIGGFMITNESGVTYHYALPVYAYKEFSKTLNTQGVDAIGNGTTQYSYETKSNLAPYATTWLLTAITGPDYVDANHDGKVDPGDWGYGISFEYGKWASDYGWRTPFNGWTKDLDQNFQDYSTGLKELYYLDAIITPSNTALFSKEMRADGKGAIMDNTAQADPTQGTQSLYPTPQLRLDDIILLNNSDLTSLTNTTNVNDAITSIRSRGGYNTFTQSDPNLYLANSSATFFGNNVIDKFDIAAVSGLQNDILRDVSMNYDYSLCPNTTNSFDAAGQAYVNQQPFSYSNYAQLGKLTLKGVTLLGKHAQPSIPPTTFEYDLPSDLVKSAANITYNGPGITTGVYNFQDPGAVFSQGDMIMFTQNSQTYYGLVKQIDPGNIIEIYINSPPGLTQNAAYTFTTTKNPPYNANNYDMWGMYKADYISSTNRNLDRMPSTASAIASDAWSLRRIHQALGMTTDIVYEPDNYSNVALYTNPAIIINSVANNAANNSITVTTTNNPQLDFRSFIKVGNTIQLMIAGTQQVDQQTPVSGTNAYSTTTTTYQLNPKSSYVTVTAVSSNSLTIQDAGFYYNAYTSLTASPPAGTVKHPPVYTCGAVWPAGTGNTSGGGIRISKVTNKEPITGVTMQVAYNYNRPGTAFSSGTTSYEPMGIDAVTMQTVGMSATAKATIAKDYSNVLGLARIIPGPGVMYEYVGVSVSRTADGQTVQQLGGTQYQFEVFNKGMVGIVNQKHGSTGPALSNVLIQDYSSRVGDLKRVIQYDNNNNKLSETINSYLYDQQSSESVDGNRAQYSTLLNNQYNNQGLIMERTAEGRTTTGTNTCLITTTRAQYPNVATGSTTINYKTGSSTTGQTLGFDFYSGSPATSLSYDSYGNRFIDVVTPAYSIYPQMGLKSINITNANMLTQAAGEVVYTADANNNHTGVVSASATIWSNQTSMLNDAEQAVNTLNANYNFTSNGSNVPLNIWRQYQTFSWMPPDRTTGVTLMPNFSPFNFSAVNGAPWTMTSQLTLYNKYSAGLESFDINGMYSAVRMGYNMSKITAAASNSNYSEMAYAGLEDGVLSGTALPGGLNLGSATIAPGISHTGIYSALLSSGKSGLYYTVSSSKLRAGRNYTASVWVQTTGANATLYYKINGGTAQLATVNTSKTAGGWTLVSLQIPASAITANASLEVGCINNGTANAYFDDFRFKPMNSAMNAYVYDPTSGELSFILDGNNLFTQFQYDTEGRLTNTYRETIGYATKQVSQNKYNYGTH